MQKLPERLSDLLELAVNDAQALELFPQDVGFDMGEWVVKPLLSEQRCMVCLAGAAVVGHVFDKLQPLREAPDIDADTWDSMEKLNQLRKGVSCDNNVSALLLPFREKYLKMFGPITRPKHRLEWSEYREMVDVLRKNGY